MEAANGLVKKTMAESMTDVQKLVERLRVFDGSDIKELYTKAADAIEQMARERDELLTEQKRYKALNSELCHAHNLLLVDGCRWEARATTAEQSLEAERRDARRYRKAFVSVLVLLTHENPDYHLIPGAKAFALEASEGFTEDETMREVLLQGIGNEEALSALASGWDLDASIDAAISQSPEPEHGEGK